MKSQRSPRQIVKEMWKLRQEMAFYLAAQSDHHAAGRHAEARHCQEMLDGLFGELRGYREQLGQARRVAV